ncbi:hypothetical protein ACFXPV_23885 [Streptomyces sp. NPDC059118]
MCAGFMHGVAMVAPAGVTAGKFPADTKLTRAVEKKVSPQSSRASDNRSENLRPGGGRSGSWAGLCVSSRAKRCS